MNHWIKILTVILLLVDLHSSAQTKFVKNFDTPNDDMAHDVLELPNGNYLFAGQVQEPMNQNISSDGIIFLTDNGGNVLNSKKLLHINDTVEYSLSSVYNNNDGSYTIFGTKGQVVNGNIWFNRLVYLRINDNLDILAQKEILVDSSINTMFLGTMKMRNEYYCFVRYASDGILINRSFTRLIKMDVDAHILKMQEMDSLFYNTSLYVNAASTWKISSAVDSNSLWISSSVNMLPFPVSLVSSFYHLLQHVDTNFTLLDTFNVFNLSPNADTTFLIRFEAQNIHQSQFFIGDLIHLPFALDYIGVAKYDVIQRKYIKITLIPQIPSESALTKADAYNHAIDVNPVYGTYIAGFSNWGTPGLEFTNYNNHIITGNIDTAGNLAWYKFIGGDSAYYSVSNIKALSDGGVMILAARYDHGASLQRDYYIIKLNKNGEYTAVSNLSFNEIEIKLYPNPATTALFIETPREDNYRLQLTSTDGKDVIIQTCNCRKIETDVSNLSTGVYTWSLYNKERKIKSGLWLKK